MIKVLLNSTQNAALFVNTCCTYDEDIDYKSGRFILDAKSFLGVISMPLDKEAYVDIHTDDEKIRNQFISDIKLWVIKEA
ncbi:HPr family phosphocarrier protein [Faecalicatena contorta]|uniref:HPr family phosphocarrier protein n=1 Tax=Faecalicatena contorta TaxID=39482 RepID=UPI0019602C16|nr:HPr family phosphocarrier protein [Faecalicatena contorta]MBM6685530.1 HPr family phosphocarrier protein [Faecalicatena contorta]MBM6710273.1 HPr family phosphocarrier protein [Faecalicatena contorta]